MLELLGGGCGGDEQTVPVAYIQQLGIILDKEVGWISIPAVMRPTMRVPPMLVCTMGITSPSSASKAE